MRIPAPKPLPRAQSSTSSPAVCAIAQESHR
jgi:hypothetical protein